MPVMGSTPSTSMGGDTSSTTMTARDGSASPSNEMSSPTDRARRDREEALARVQKARQEKAEYREYWGISTPKQSTAPTYQNVMKEHATTEAEYNEYRQTLAAWENREYSSLAEADTRAAEKQAAQHRHAQMWTIPNKQVAYIEQKRAEAKAAEDAQALAYSRAVEKAEFETMVENKFIRDSQKLAEKQIAKYRQPQPVQGIDTEQMRQDIQQSRSIMAESLKTVPFQTPEDKAEAIKSANEYYDRWDTERKAIAGEQLTRNEAQSIGMDKVPASMTGGKDVYVFPVRLVKEEREAETATDKDASIIDRALAGYEAQEAKASAWVKARTPDIAPQEDWVYNAVLAGQRLSKPGTPKELHEFSTQYTIDFYQELREKPLYAGTMLVGTAALFPIGRGVGFLARTAPAQYALRYVPQVIKSGASVFSAGLAVGIGAAYAGSVGYRVATDEYGNIDLSPRQMGGSLGGITSTELLPMAVGAYAGSKITNYAADVIATRGLKEIPTEAVIPKEILSGEKMFPTAEAGTAHPEKVIKMYEGAGERVGIDPAIIGGYHATPDRFISPATVQAGPRYGGEGLHLAPEPSPFFLGITEEGYSLIPRALLPTGSRPAVMFVDPAKITRIPKAARGNYQSMAEWFNTQAELGKAYVTPKYETDWLKAERETEVMITVNSELEKLADLAWFKFKGRRVIIEDWIATQGRGENPAIAAVDLAGIGEYQATKTALSNPIVEVESLYRPGSRSTARISPSEAYRYRPEVIRYNPLDEGPYRPSRRYPTRVRETARINRGKLRRAEYEPKRTQEYGRYNRQMERLFRESIEYRPNNEYRGRYPRETTIRRYNPSYETVTRRYPARERTPYIPPFIPGDGKARPKGTKATAHRRDIFHSIATPREMLLGGQKDLLGMPSTVETKRTLNKYKWATSAELEKTLPKEKTVTGKSSWKAKNPLVFEKPPTKKDLVDELVFGPRATPKKKRRRRR